jgi:sigma-E factor negative regulatory protein RseC
MLAETGRVVALDEGAVWVETQRQGSCGSCAARSGCGHGLLASMGRGPALVRALLVSGSPGNIALHDRVRISLPERSFLRGVAMLYLLPLLSTIICAALSSAALEGSALSQAAMDLRVTLAAGAGLGAGLLCVRAQSRRHAGDPSIHPVVTERLQNAD